MLDRNLRFIFDVLRDKSMLLDKTRVITCVVMYVLCVMSIYVVMIACMLYAR